MLSGVTSSVVVRVLYQIIIYMSSNENLSLQICIYIYMLHTQLYVYVAVKAVSPLKKLLCLPVYHVVFCKI